MNPADESSTSFSQFRSLGARLTRNALWLLTSKIATQGLMALFTILIARRMGDVGLGQYAFIASVIFLANVATTFGTDMLVIRVIAADGNLTAVPAAILVQIILTIPAIVLIWLIPGGWFNLSPDGISGLRIYSFALIPMSIINVLSAGLRGLERMDILALLSTIGPVMQVVATWFLVYSQGIVFLAQVLLALQAAYVLVASLLFIRVVPSVQGLWRTSASDVRRIAYTSLPIALLGGVGIFYQRAIIYLLMLLSGPAAAGWYSAASRVVEVPKFGHYALMGALLPMMAQDHARSGRTSDARSFFSGALYLSLGLSTAAALLLYLTAQPVVTLIYGQVFAPAILILQILAGVLVPYTITNYVSIRILAIGQERLLLRPLVMATLALIPACVWAFSRWGVPGAAGAVVGVEWLLAALYLVVWRRLTIATQRQI